MPSDSTTRRASVKLEALEVLYGMRIACTFSGPSARAHKNAVTAESTPPDRPTTALRMLRRAISSSCKNATSHRSVTSARICGGRVKSAGFASMTGNTLPRSGDWQFVVQQQVRKHRVEVAEQG